MENDVLDSLTDLGLEGSFDEDVFSEALDKGVKSLEYTKIVYTLAEQLKLLCKMEETISLMTDPDESSSFLLELSSFLKELGCPYKKLVTGHMSSRLQSKADRILLLDYLVSELMAARICAVDRPKVKHAGMQIIVQETPTAKNLKDILISLKINKPPPNIGPDAFFSKLEDKLQEAMQKEGETLIGKPLYSKALNEEEWKELDDHFSQMFEEYQLRRETLITRLECTIKSFEWSDRLRGKRDLMQTSYRPKRDQLKVKPDVRLSDLLAARLSLLTVEKTSSASVRKNTQSTINKVIIGQVPDRGGRPSESQPPPPEMPSWQQRVAGPANQRGGFGGGRGGGRGGSNDNGVVMNRGGGRGGSNDNGVVMNRGGGRGGRVQGGYNQGNHGDNRAHHQPQTAGRGYQTYEVPPGGYNQSYHKGGGQIHSYDTMSGYQGGGNIHGAGHRGGYQNEHDDRDRRGRGSYNRGGRR